MSRRIAESRRIKHFLWKLRIETSPVKLDNPLSEVEDTKCECSRSRKEIERLFISDSNASNIVAFSIHDFVKTKLLLVYLVLLGHFR